MVIDRGAENAGISSPRKDEDLVPGRFIISAEQKVTACILSTVAPSASLDHGLNGMVHTARFLINS